MSIKIAKKQIRNSKIKDNDIDILKIIKPFKEKLSLPDFKLKTIEKYLGIYREDTISGKESVQLYNEYVSSNCNKLKDKILLHNYEDISKSNND